MTGPFRRLRAAEVVPSPAEAATAVAALEQARAELGIAKTRLKFFTGDPLDRGDVGYFEPPRTVWCKAGQPPDETAATVFHECGHAAQHAADRPVSHGHHRDWRQSLPERYARGDPGARNKLRTRVEIAQIVHKVTKGLAP